MSVDDMAATIYALSSGAKKLAHKDLEIEESKSVEININIGPCIEDDIGIVSMNGTNTPSPLVMHHKKKIDLTMNTQEAESIDAIEQEIAKEIE